MPDPAHGPIAAKASKFYVEAYSAAPAFAAGALIPDVTNFQCLDTGVNQPYESTSTGGRTRRIPGIGDTFVAFDILSAKGALKFATFDRGDYVAVKAESVSGTGVTNGDMIVGDIRALVTPRGAKLVGLHVELEGDGAAFVAVP